MGKPNRFPKGGEFSPKADTSRSEPIMHPEGHAAFKEALKRIGKPEPQIKEEKCYISVLSREMEENNKRMSKAIHGPMSSESSQVDHPHHYGGKDNPYEAIKVIEAWELGFNLGNVVKYISRAGAKGDKLQDLEKALWYLSREIHNLKYNQ